MIRSIPLILLSLLILSCDGYKKRKELLMAIVIIEMRL